jgi:PleD family two-component response regulator
MTGLAAAERLRPTTKMVRKGEVVHIIVSTGIAQLEPSLGGWEEMMRRADWAMYKARARG